MTTPSLTVVRPARVEDIPALVPLVERYWAFEEVAGFDAANTARALQALLADERSGAGWMVVEGTTIVGSLLAVYVFSLEHGGLTVEIDEFFLDEGWRGAGLGRQFLETAEAAFLARGCSNVSFRIGRHNLAARCSYERLGYRSVDGFDLMEKPLRWSRLPRNGPS